GLVTAITSATRLPVTIHSHSTTALAPISYFAAIEAGATGIDTALSALAWGASQPATETMVASLREAPYDTGLDLNPSGQAKRYQHIEQPFRDYVKGLFGEPPGPIDPEVRKRALGSSNAITLRPADLLQPGIDRARREMRKQGLNPSGVDQVLTYILFPEDAP